MRTAHLLTNLLALQALGALAVGCAVPGSDTSTGDEPGQVVRADQPLHAQNLALGFRTELRKGQHVAGVIAGSPAYEAGIRTFDLIYAKGGLPYQHITDAFETGGMPAALDVTQDFDYLMPSLVEYRDGLAGLTVTFAHADTPEEIQNVFVPLVDDAIIHQLARDSWAERGVRARRGTELAERDEALGSSDANTGTKVDSADVVVGGSEVEVDSTDAVDLESGNCYMCETDDPSAWSWCDEGGNHIANCVSRPSAGNKWCKDGCSTSGECACGSGEKRNGKCYYDTNCRQDHWLGKARGSGCVTGGGIAYCETTFSDLLSN